MTDTSNWKYYYKTNPDGSLGTSNMLYTPKINPEKTVMCMSYNIDLQYKDNDNNITEDLLKWFFEREIKFLDKFSHLSTTPKVYDINFKNKQVFIEWNKETLSQIMYDSTRNLDQELPDWQLQIKNFLISAKQNKFYKMALYPHCFYIAKDGNLKTIDYYSVVPFEERFIERRIIEDIIGADGAYRFDESTDQNGFIDFRKCFEITVTKHLNRFWSNDFFNQMFKEIYQDE